MKQLYMLLLSALSTVAYCQTGIAVPQMSACDSQVQSLMTTYNIPSATFALTKDGKLVFSRSYGNSNIGQNVPTQPYNMFRIASISKPITAIGIMKMVENGQISLDDTVFGTGGILENHWSFSSATITDNRVYDITVRMLLEHSAGWDRDIDCLPNPTSPYPWDFNHCDPIAVPLHVTQTLGESNPVIEEYLIAFLLEKNLNHDPGTTYSYSNMGYLVLSEIIEEISGMDYEQWMQQEILHPLGIYDMHIGKNMLTEKAEREGEYVGNGYTTYSLYNDNTVVPWEYGGFSVEAMDGHGGWIASARDLLRLMAATDGFATKPDILSAETIATMVTPSATNAWYAKGWSVNTLNNWWHTGALDGTASMLVRSSGGYTWALILNKRIVNSQANAFWAAVDNLGWNCLAATSTYPTHDLFDSPLQPAQNLATSDITSTSMELNWESGDGTRRVVVMRAVESPSAAPFLNYPIDGTEYAATENFSTSPSLADGTRVVYDGTGSSTVISGLSPNQLYAIRVYEYSKTVVNGNNALYLLGQPAQLFQTTANLGLADQQQSFVSVYPNPAKDFVTVTSAQSASFKNISIADANGRVVKTVETANETETAISVSDLASGVYFMTVTSGSEKAVKKIIRE